MRVNILIVAMLTLTLWGCVPEEVEQAKALIAQLQSQVDAEKAKGEAGDQKKVAQLDAALVQAKNAVAILEGNGGDVIQAGAQTAATALPFPYNLIPLAALFLFNQVAGKKKPVPAPVA